MQTQQILNHLRRYGSIEPLQALNLYAARCHDLRSQGHNIETVMIEKDEKKFARYTLK